LHRDPFDRILVAQAVAEPVHLLTGDRKMLAYSDVVRMADVR
jgi:PIN domain nuclease of toxin-antitoxin system